MEIVHEPVTFIVPVRNGEKRLPKLLSSIRSQEYPQDLIDILLVDDDSTDGTLAVGREFGARMVRNGSRDCERGKTIGLERALHDLVIFVDDDNALPGEDWLQVSLSAFLSVPDAVGAQPARFAYAANDGIANRYQSIFGGTDPVVSYLGRRDRLTCWTQTWDVAGQVLSESDDAWVIKYSSDAVPTLGAQGFISRRSILQTVPWAPLYFHIDVCANLVAQGHDTFVMLKRGIVHDHCDSVSQMLAKMRRNMRRFLRDGRKRTYTYAVSAPKKIVTALVVATAVVPSWVGLRSYAITRDRASLLHPLVCVAVMALYALEALNFALENTGRRLARLTRRTRES